jgi:hypothetical protein
LVEGTLAGSASEDEVVFFLSSLDPKTDMQIAGAVHAAVHFFDDADVRSKDLEYDRLARTHLDELLKKLKEQS